MKIIKQMKRYSQIANRAVQHAEFYLCVAMFFAFFIATVPSHAASIAPSVPPVVYTESYEDLRVKVLGGFIVIQRTFSEGKWLPNYNWANLEFTFDSFDGSVKTITRGKAEYTKTGPGVYSFRKRDTIRQTTTGFRWADRSGNWVDFDAQGQIQTYGDRNDVKVSFIYETYGTGKRVSGIKDHLDHQVLWYQYTGDLLTAIRDYSNRRVEYRYTNNQLTSVIDANGNIWSYGYTGSLPTIFTDPENRTITRTWVGNGELASIRYADGTGTDYKYEYDSSKTLFYRQERTTAGKVTESWIDPNNEVVRQDLNGKSLKMLVIDTYSRTRVETDARGLATAREYDQWDNVTKITYPDGATVTTNYDPVFSQPTQKTDELRTITKYEYDTKGNLTRLTEALGLPEQRVTEYTYDQYGNRLTEKRLGDAVTLEALTKYEYNDSYGNLTAVVDPENYRTEYSYDVMGNALTTKDARNKIWIRTYDNRGKIKTDSDSLNHTTTLAYDKSGLRTKITDAASNDTSYGYDARGNTLTITDPYGGISKFEYNSDNQRIKQLDQEGKSRATEYDIDGRLTKQTDGNGNTLQYFYGDEASSANGLLIKVIYPTFSRELKYDNYNRITEVIDALDANTSYNNKIGYDAAGNRTSTTDKENKTTTYIYDSLGHLKTVTDPANGITEYTYDNRDNLIALKDPKGNTHRFEYDKRNLKIKEIRPLGQVIGYTYDPARNLTSITDPKGQTKRYSYDDAGRRTGESHYLTATDTTATKTVIYSLNDLGSITGYNDGITQGSTNYDAKQIRKIGETINYGIFSLSYSYDYYANGRKKSFTAPDGVTVNYNYDSNNQLSSIALPTGNFTVNQYNWTTPTQITFPGGATRTQNYDALMRLKGIQVKDPTQNEILNYQYTYDKADNITQTSTEHGIYSYSYDNLYRLTQVTNPSPFTTETYSYDQAGNRITDSNISGTLSYNNNNQITAYSNVTLEYDANGNAIRKIEGTNTTTFVYDTNDRLVEIKDTNNNTVVKYTYDPSGRRLWKEINNTRIYYFYGDEGLIAEADNAGALTNLYGYKPSSTWDTDLVYLKQGNNYYFYQNDQLGTSQKLIAQNGTVVWSATTRAFGQTSIDPASTITNNLRFLGQYYDAETGMHYNWNRYYDPTIGRYISSDPIEVDEHAEIALEDLYSSDALSSDPVRLTFDLNLYVYTINNPFYWFDSTGLAHDKGARESTRGKHEGGEARRKRDQGGEKGDKNRDLPRKPPPGHKGPWPPKPPEGDGNSKSVMCDEGCQKTLVWTGVAIITVCCVLQPEICLGGLIVGGAAAQ